MSLEQILIWLHIAVSLSLVVLILLANAEEGGLGGAFGGGNEGGGTFRTRRGLERVLFNTTIFLGVVFAALSFAWLYI